MLSALSPSEPSENIFAKDPIDFISEFLDKYTTTASNERFGVHIEPEHLKEWEQLPLGYELNDLDLAIQGFNGKWKGRVDY